MTMHKKLRTRILSMALSLAMVFTMLPMQSLATTGDDSVIGASNITEETIVCENHKTHEEDCDYIKAKEAKPCGHLQEDGYSCAPILDSDSVNDNIASPSEADADYLCTHSDDCGYAEAIEGADCTHTCEKCTVVEQSTQSEAYKNVMALFTALPTADSITSETTDEERNAISDQIDAAMVAFEALNAEEQGKLQAEHTALLENLVALREALTGTKIQNLVDKNATDPTVDTWKRIYANGIAITIAASIDDPKKTNISYLKDGKETFLFDEDIDLSGYTIFGGSASTAVESTHVTMTSGTVNKIYGGSRDTTTTVENTSITVSGGTVKYYIYGGSLYGTVTGTTSVDVSGNAVVMDIYGGGEGESRSNSGKVNNTSITISGGKITNVNGGGSYSAVTGNTSVTVSGGTITNVYGGGRTSQATAGDTNISVSGDAVVNVIYGGGLGSSDDSGNVNNTNITISGGTIKDSVYGGGSYSAVIRDTSVAVSGGTITKGVYGGGRYSKATVGGTKTVAVGSAAKIGSVAEGIVINSKTVENGVASFEILPDLTADSSINVVLPSGHVDGVIATGAIASDVAKIKLVGKGAQDKVAYLDGTDIQVKASLLTGTVAISGELKFGKQLKAVVGDSNNTGTLSYQWKRGETKIGEGDTYTTVVEDIGQTLTCVVTSAGETGFISGVTKAVIDKLDGPAAPPAPTIKPTAKTATSITLAAVTVSGEVIEYAKSKNSTVPTADSDWQTSTDFTGLTAETQYYFFARVKESATHKAGAASAGTAIATDKSDAQKVADARAAAVAALDRYTATNTTTDSDIMALVNTATNAGITGVTAAWKSSKGFNKNNATSSAAGNVSGTITLTINGATTDVTINLSITQLATDKTALKSTISDANTAKGTVIVNNNAASSVARGTRFVTTAEMTAFTNAIAAAEAVAINSASTTTQVNEAIIALTNAAETFKAAIKTGTYTGGGSTGGGGGGGGGGSSSGGTTTPSTTPSTKPSTKTTEPVTGSSNTNAVVDSNGNTIVNVNDKNVSDAVKSAHEAATQKGVNAGEVTAIINVISPANSNLSTVSVNLPKTVQEQVIGSKIDHMVIAIDKPDISIGMNLATVTEMNRQANADIQLSATRTDVTNLSVEAKNTIDNRPAFDLKATYANGSNSITSFGTGLVNIAIPYTLQAGEIAGGLYAVYVDGSGNVSYINNSSYDADNKVLRFATNRFSVYGIGYKAPVGFTDIANHWAKTDIGFVVNRGLISGTSDTTFEPNSAMTRGAYLTAIGKLFNVDVSGYKTDTYYAPYVTWAVEKGIVKDTTDTTFAPDQAITRQEMATIMSSYVKALGYQVPETRAAVTFADNDSIASWAAPAVKQMQMAGILSSKNSNRFDPTGTATRGEISAMLHRYVELIIDRTTTEGWSTNDSGSSMYYQSGKAVTGTNTIGGVAYNFNSYGETTR